MTKSGSAEAAPPVFAALSSARALRVPVELSSTDPGALHSSAQLFDGSFGAVVSVQSSGLDSKLEFAPAKPETASTSHPPLTRDDLPQWLGTLKRNGVGARRNSSPDLIEQLKQALDRPIDTVICNLLDADPSIPLNSALAGQFSAELVGGIGALKGACGAERAWIIADANLPALRLAALRGKIRGSAIKLIPVANDYPQADPTLLLYSLLDRRLRPGRLPVEQGVVVLDAAAAVAVGRHVLLNERMSLVPLAVRDHIEKRTHFVAAPIGMSLGEILKQLGINYAGAILRGGDLLRDRRIGADAVASHSELTIHVCSPEPAINPEPCIRCGWCVEACPTRVHPAAVLEAAQREDTVLAERAGVEACIECGICSYVCPSRLPLLQAARTMRAKLIE